MGAFTKRSGTVVDVWRGAAIDLSLGLEPDGVIAIGGAAALPPKGLGAPGDFVVSGWIHKSRGGAATDRLNAPGGEFKASGKLRQVVELLKKLVVDQPVKPSTAGPGFTKKPIAGVVVQGMGGVFGCEEVDGAGFEASSIRCLGCAAYGAFCY